MRFPSLLSLFLVSALGAQVAATAAPVLEFRLVAPDAPQGQATYPVPGGRESVALEDDVLLDVRHVASAKAEKSKLGMSQIDLVFTPDGAKVFADVTGRSVGRRLAMLVNGKILSLPTIQARITGGKAIIAGSFSWLEAVRIAAFINAAVKAEPDASAIFYVSPEGDDAWSGKTPERKGQNGPFLTIQRARDAVRALPKAGRRGPVRVRIRGGIYALEKTLTFAPEDSGTEASPVIYEAYENEQPIICGGRRLTGWRVVDGGKVWQLELPEVKAGNWTFGQLFGARKGSSDLTRRYRPAKGMLAVAALTYAPAKKAMSHRAAQDEFEYFPGDLEPWENLDDVEIVALHCWSSSRLRIRELDTGKRIVKFTGFPTFRIGHWWPNNRNPYYAVNIKELFREPGQWYLDRPTGVLSYRPLPGETPANTDLIAPLMEQVVDIKGDFAKESFVEHLTFSGLAFSVSQWTLPKAGYGGSQAMPDLPAAIEAEGARFCTLQRCTVSSTGAYAIGFGKGCHENRMEGLKLYDLGGGGIKIGDIRMNRNAEYPELPTGNVVSNCLITDGGIVHYSANAVWAGIVRDTSIVHNEIRNFPYSGIAVGWSWSSTPTMCGGNHIDYNHIHNVVSLLGDGASIYTLGNQPGTTIRNNHIHDNTQSRFAYQPWQLAIYLDEGSGHILTENNLVYRVGTHAFNINGGGHNTTRNNLFGPTHNAGLPFIRCNLGKHEAEDNTLTGNVMYWNGDVLIDTAWAPDKCHADGNLYWNFAGKPITFAGKTFAEWQAMGQDVNSRIADPKFVDPANADFRLQPDSPALAMGFKPFDASEAGLEPAFQDLDSPSPVVALPPIYSMPVPPEREMPFGFELDLEDVPLGLCPRGFGAGGFTKTARFEVVEGDAASGTRCLKATDEAGLSRSFYPYINCSQKLDKGAVRIAFDLKLDAESPAAITTTVRDNPSAKPLGKEFVGAFSLDIAADGKMTASGKALGTMPLGTWTHFEILLPVGQKTGGKYKLTVGLLGENGKSFELPIDSPDFHVFSWLGFIAGGEQNGVFYLDNLVLRAAE
jgi:hypothetical protein